MASNSKLTPTSENLQRTTYHFVLKRKILKRSACESKTLKGSIRFHTGRESVWPATPCVRFLYCYYPFSEELTIQKSVIFKGERVVILVALRSTMINKTPL